MDEQIDSAEELTLRDLIQETFREYERTQNEMNEIGVLVKQSAAEVERLSQHNARVGTYLRQLQTNFDTIPREDIKEGYEALINAMKFSRQRTFITVFVSVAGRHVTLSIINDPEKGEEGIMGIPTEYEKVVFEPFFRLSKLVFERFHTLDFGLGLTLIEKIIGKHGGEVTIRNIVDHSDLKREAQVRVNLTINLPLEVTS